MGEIGLRLVPYDFETPSTIFVPTAHVDYFGTTRVYLRYG